MRKVPVSQEIVGKKAAKSVYAPSGKYPLVHKGATIVASMVDALLRRGVQAIWIADEIFPDFEPEEAIRHETRELVHKSVADLFHHAATGEQSRQAKETVASGLMEAVRQLVDDVVANEDVVANVGRVRAWDNYTYEHSVQVATMSVVIGKHMLMTEDQLIRLGTGAILHDVGKITVPLEILQKPGRLTAEEFEVVKTHARNGWDLVHEGFQNIMPTSSIVVLQHHERLDGSGYPQGLRGDDIYIFSKITAVADVLDAVRAQRNYRENHRPSQVLRIMMNDAGIRLDATSVQIALRHVALVGEGEIVRLTNGLLGMVTRLNLDAPLQPVVTVVADDQDMPVAREELDLRQGDLQIADVLDEWPAVLVQPDGSKPIDMR